MNSAVFGIIALLICIAFVSTVASLISEAQKLFAGVSCAELERLQRTQGYARELTETVARKISFLKKTRQSQVGELEVLSIILNDAE